MLPFVIHSHLRLRQRNWLILPTRCQPSADLAFNLPPVFNTGLQMSGNDDGSSAFYFDKVEFGSVGFV